VPAGINFKWNHSNLDKGRELGREAAEAAITEYKNAGITTLDENKEIRFINERKDGKEGRHIDKERLAGAIALAKGTIDRGPWLERMDWWVDAKSGKKVEPDKNGKYPKGSIPYPEFAINYPEVKTFYYGRGAILS
jgi:hypothetical protein